MGERSNVVERKVCSERDRLSGDRGGSQRFRSRTGVRVAVRSS